MDVQDDRSLVISKYALDCQKYYTVYSSVTWETCSLRSWLNGIFLKEAFSTEEQDKIPKVTVTADKNPRYSIGPGKDTQDRVYLLSIPEVKQYFASDAERQCKPTAYAIAQECYANSTNGSCWWWLRSNHAASAYFDGSVSYGGRNHGSDFIAVRPALWIDTSLVESDGETSDKEKPEPEEPDPLKDYKTVGSIVTFGSYEQDNNLENGKEPIEWIVLDVQDGKSLLISRYALDSQRYNTENKAVTWETCSLRKWLNDSFLRGAFSTEEQAKIPTVTVTADRNPNYSTDPGKDTQDRMFMLSIPEVNCYFTSNEARQCKPTAYATSKWRNVNRENGNCWWWLRSPGIYSNRTVYADYDGVVIINGNYVDYDYYAIRPALWINLDS